MAETSCEICFNDFDEQQFIPKVLDCGHSLCQVCITRILNKSPSYCPQCRRPLQKTEPDEYPTNFSLLSLSTTSKQLNTAAEPLKYEATLLRSNFVTQIHIANENIKAEKRRLNFLERGLSQLREIENSRCEDIRNVKESLQLIKDLKKEFNKNAELYAVNARSSNIIVTFNLRNFESKNEYLHEVFSSVRFGEKIYSVEWIKDQVKYGHISVWANFMFIHALSASQVPQNARLVWFQDIKVCLNGKNIQTFLVMSRKNEGLEQTAMIELENTPLTHQFIRLCTGECGPIYKGSSYRRVHDDNSKFRPILEVMQYISNGAAAAGRVDYATDSNVLIKCNINDIVVFAWEEGSFVLSKCVHEGMGINIIGKVISPNLEEFISEGNHQYMKITDSGIAYSFMD